MPQPRSLAMMLVLLLPLGCNKVQSTINPSDANLFNQEWAAMKARGARSTHPAELPGEATQQLFRNLLALEAKLDAGPLAALAAQEVPTERGELAEWLQQLQPLLRDISSLLEKPLIKASIQKGQHLAQRPSQRLEIDPPTRFATPALPRLLRLVRPLCGSAIHCALTTKDSNACVRSLVQALDLIQLFNDDSLAALRRNSVLGSEVLEALRTLLPRTTVPAEFLRSQLEPRLALAMQPGRLEKALNDEALYRMAIGSSVVLTPELPANAYGLRFLDCTAEQAVERCLQFLAINKSVRTHANICNLVAKETARGVMLPEVRAIDEFHNFEIACHLARLALALNEHKWITGNWPGFLNELEGFANGLPAPPCNARRVDYQLDFNGMRLTCFDRASNNKQPDYQLHQWSWSKQDLSDLNARR